MHTLSRSRCGQVAVPALAPSRLPDLLGHCGPTIRIAQPPNPEFATVPSYRIVGMLRFASIAIIVLAAATAHADRIRVAVQKTGTLAWEIDVIKRHGIDRKLGLAIETVELASPEAGKVALKGGSADIMLTDWLWVARERSLGDTLVFYPASSALGAVMVPAQSSIRSVLDLKDKKLAVAGGPLDKSWLL